MPSTRFHPLSLLAGCGLALVAFLAMGQSAARAPRWEYRIVDDVKPNQLEGLATEGWEFDGYLGQGTKGTTNSQTLWKRARE